METKIWAAIISCNGLYSDKPIKVIEDEQFGGYFNPKIDSFIIYRTGLGLCINEQTISFTSKNKAEVETWISGAKALNTVLKNNVFNGAFYELPRE